MNDTNHHHVGALALDEDVFPAREPAIETLPPDVRVSVVIPAHNEAANLAYVFSRLPAGLHQVIIVDGHSTDGTAAEARRLRPDVQLVNQPGTGKGDALAAGFAACTGDVVVMLDADGSTDPREIPRFVAALHAGADYVKGSRYAQGGGSTDLTPIRRLGNSLLCWLVNRLYGTSYTDLCYGYVAFWRRCLPYIHLDVTGFEVETALNVRVARAGLVVHEVPSFERARLNGSSDLKEIRDGLLIVRTIARERVQTTRRQRALLATRGRPLG